MGLTSILAVGSTRAQDQSLEQWLDHVERSLHLPRSAIGLMLEPIDMARAERQSLSSTSVKGLPAGEGYQSPREQRFPGRTKPQRLPSQALRWQHRANEAMNPASTIKLLTSFAALQLLGPEFRWKTSWRASALPQEGVLSSDLIMRGSGDPKLLIEDLRTLITALRRAGLHEIRGDLLLDASLYAVDVSDAPPIDGDWQQPYNVAPLSTELNFRSFKLAWGGGQNPSIDPPLAGLDVVDRLKKPRAACKDASASFQFESDSRVETRRLVSEGRWPTACGRGERYIAYPDAIEFADRLFRAAWLEQGGIWHGRARRVDGAAVSAPIEILLWTSSANLLDVVMDVNKLSNNLLSRHLWLQLSAREASPASVEASLARLRAWLQSQRLSLPSLVIENGSGLSRNERISPRDMTQILQLAQRLPIGASYQESLPVAGVDGTMKSRLTEPGFRGHLWLKTGTLNEVSAIAGYIEARSGQRYTITLMINHPRAAAARQAVDKLLRVIVATG